MPGVSSNGHALSAPVRTMDLLRFATAGSVDDGKSTLIGRLLFDSKAIFQDQMEHVEEVSERLWGNSGVNLALLTDGLRAEREQGITIDVAYRYFATPRRKFIIADTPGHVQYTRNMVTGASTADLALILVDARKGVLEQSRRHAYIASLLGIPHVVVCVNKMDLVEWDEAVFDRIEQEFRSFAAGLEIRDLTFIPVSALLGDNVVERSMRMDWYEGSSLLHHLEHVHIASDRNLHDARFPVQWVIRPVGDDEHHDYRGYAGQVAAGVLRVGDDVAVLPGGQRSRIAAIDGPEGAMQEAFPPMSVTIRLEDEIDISRGDLICHPGDEPMVTREVEAELCWMSEQPLHAGGRYAIKHTTRTARAIVEEIVHRVDVHTLQPDGNGKLDLNDIGRVRLRLSAPLMADRYRDSRATGAFILIDEATNDTVAAGMIVGGA